MRLALTAGGTGGHIIPALAVLDALRTVAPAPLDVRFFGPDDRGERAMVEGRGVEFVVVPAAGVRGRGPARLVKSAWKLLSGTAIAFRRLREFRPDAVFSTGGYASFPGSVAARLLRRPLVVYLPDVTPGWAVQAEKRLATHIATSTEAALEHLPLAKTKVTGYPVREEFFSTNRDEARRALGARDGEKVVLIAGATQGAHAINRAVFDNLVDLLRVARLVHVTGPADIDRALAARDALAADLAERYAPAAYRDDLPQVMVAADLAVMRSGASTLGELPAAALPAVLVPGTFAGGHQAANANWLAGAGAAVVLPEDQLSSLTRTVGELLASDDRLAAMREAAASLAHPHAAAAIASLVLEAAR